MNISTWLLFGQTSSEQTDFNNKVNLTAPDQQPHPLF